MPIPDRGAPEGAGERSWVSFRALGALSLGFRAVLGLGFRRFGFRGFGFRGFGFRVLGLGALGLGALGFGASGLGFRGFEFRVQG